MLKNFFLPLLPLFIVFFCTAMVLNAQELSKEEATRILLESMKNDKIVDLKGYLKQEIFYTLKPENIDINKFKNLEEKGFVILKPLPEVEKEGKRYDIIFTEKASPYILKDDETKDKALISIGKADRIDLTELKPVAPKEYKAEFLIGYRLTPFGEILLGKQMIFERKEELFFEHRDGGWKIKLKTSF